MSSARKLSSQALNSRVAQIGLWILLAILLIPTLYQVYHLILYLALLLINSPTLRPPGWSSDTLKGVSRCLSFIVGSLWLGLVIYFESSLSEWRLAGQMPAQAGRIILIMAGVYLISALILFVIG